jgi:hypothetical protein
VRSYFPSLSRIVRLTLEFSRRCAPPMRVKNPTISGAQRSVAWACSASGRQSSGCRPHAPTTPSWYYALHNRPSTEPRASGITHGTTCRDLNHAQHTIRLPITGNQHNRRSYHTRHNGHQHAARKAQRAFRERDSPHHIIRGMPPTLPGRRTASVQPWPCRGKRDRTGRRGSCFPLPKSLRQGRRTATRCSATADSIGS